MQIICVDIGNSGMRCVRRKPTWDNHAPWYPELLRVDWHSGAGDDSTRKRLEQSLSNWLHATHGDGPCGWLVSSVQRTMQGWLAEYIGSRDHDQFRLVTYQDLPLHVDVEQPQKVGVDRLLAAHAAIQCFPNQPLIVVQAGSAITVDWIESPNRYSGGAIMPGVPMMLRLLSQAADLLPEVAAGELLELPPLPGRNTGAAMSAGVSSAVVGGVQHLIARYRMQFGRDTLVIISGGDGPRLSPHIEGPMEVVEQLVLRGLCSLNLGGTG